MSLSIAVGKPEQPATQNPWILPERTLTVLYGCPEIQRLSHYFLPRILLHQKRVLYLDGANQISPLLIARFARERGEEKPAWTAHLSTNLKAWFKESAAWLAKDSRPIG